VDPRLARRLFEEWALEWWEIWSADPDRSPTTLEATEARLRLHVRPFFAKRQLRAISPSVVKRWQHELRARRGYETVMACRSVLYRILQTAEDDGLIPTNPLRKVRAPERPVDPEEVFGETKRRALTPEEAGQLLAHFPRFWWDHVVTLLGTGLRIGEFAGLPACRVRLDRSPSVVQVAQTSYDAGQFGKGIRKRVKSAAGIREIPLAPQVVEAIRRQLPQDASSDALVFTGPGGANGHRRGTRTRLTRGGFECVYDRAIERLTDPAAAPLRPTATRVAKALRRDGPATVAALIARLAANGRALKSTSVHAALEELEATGLAIADHDPGHVVACWSPVTPPRNPVLDGLELHGPHDFRHTYATWLEDAGIPTREIDRLMGHRRGRRSERDQGSEIGTRYRHTTPAMEARIVAAVEERLAAVLKVAMGEALVTAV